MGLVSLCLTLYHTWAILYKLDKYKLDRDIVPEGQSHHLRQ